MANLPVIDMVRTGQNIGRLRKQTGMSVKDLQDVFGFATLQAIYKWQRFCRCAWMIFWLWQIRERGYRSAHEWKVENIDSSKRVGWKCLPCGPLV